MGNDLLADDAFGLVAAEELKRRFSHLDVVFTTDSGFHLLDHVCDVRLLVVVDSIQTGQVEPGRLYVSRGAGIRSASGPSPHYVGLFETIDLAKQLLHNVPNDVVILAVEVADCLTLGGEMDGRVKSAVDVVCSLVAELAGSISAKGEQQDQVSGDGLSRAIAVVSARWGSERLVVI